MRRLLPALVLAGLVAGCSSPAEGSRTVTLPTPSASPAAQGDLSAQALQGMLLQATDLPGLPSRRPSASADLTTQATPQLALCQPQQPVAPHQLANVLAQAPGPPPLKVFEVLSVYADEVGATAAYSRAVTAARACPTFQAQGTAFTVTDLADVPAGPGVYATHYRLTAPGVIAGDVRTVARKGRYTVLITGFGAAPGGQPLLDYQAGLLTAALARLP